MPEDKHKFNTGLAIVVILLNWNWWLLQEPKSKVILTIDVQYPDRQTHFYVTNNEKLIAKGKQRLYNVYMLYVLRNSDVLPFLGS